MINDDSIRLTALPGLRQRLVATWMLYAVFTLSYLVATLRSNGTPVAYGSLAVKAALQGLEWLLISWLLFYLCDFAFSRRRFWTRRPFFVLAAVAVWGLDLPLFALRMAIQRGRYPIDVSRFRADMARNFWPAITMTACIAAVARGTYWWQSELRSRRREEAIEATLVRTELSALSDQLEPHFLLNTLSGISTLAGRDVPAAQEMLLGLKQLLRYPLESEAAASVTLREELQFIRQYLSLQSMRFPGRLAFTITAPPSLLDCTVPRLILQPVVENALKHGVAQRVEGGEITVEAAAEGTSLLLRVRNSTGRGLALPGIGIGVACVRARLELLFGNDQKVEMREDETAEATTVTVAMPLTGTAGKAA